MKKNVIAVLLAVVLAAGNIGTVPAQAVEANVEETSSNDREDSSTEKQEEISEKKDDVDIMESLEDTTVDEPLDQAQEASTQDPSEPNEYASPTESTETIDNDEELDTADVSGSSEEIVEADELSFPTKEDNTEAAKNSELTEEENEVDSGTWGENITWSLTGTGDSLTLFIDGTGEMHSGWYYNPYPWKSYKESIVNVIIDEGVTSIGNEAFDACSSLTSITIPGTVTTIGSYAFQNCVSLTSIIIPEGVASIGSGAFNGCNGLISITLPEGMINIGDAAFYYCTSLTSITIPEGVTSIENDTFCNCNNLTSITIPESVTSIGERAFNECSSLASITIPENVTNIEYCAFCNCDGLTSIIIPEGVTSIEGNTFFECSNLTSITLPESLTSIGEVAFEECGSLTNIIIPDSVTNIGKRAFYKCSSLTSIIIPEGVTSIDDLTFGYCGSLTDITIPEGVTSIGERAFYKCGSLTSITIPEGVTSIGRDAFYYCESLISITLPESLTAIGIDAFYSCTNLASISIPESVNRIGSGAFGYCSSLTSITIPEGVTSINNFVFEYCSNLTSITLPESVEIIGDSAFQYCSSLTNITIPEDVTTIGEKAFYKCSSLTSIIIPEGVTSIDDLTFGYCGSLTDITIPEGVTSIGVEAFKDCRSLISITIPESVTNIGYSAFYFCQNLTSITIPVGVTNIGNDAFRGCSSISSIHVPSINVWLNFSYYIFGSMDADYAKRHLYIGGEEVTDIIIPEGTTSIKESAFFNCASLTSITIPESVTSIEKHAFSGCRSLNSINIPEGVTSIEYNTFCRCSSLTSITLPESLTSIMANAFKYCSSLTSITIPEGVTSIENSVFEYCSNLTSITLPESLTSINIYAFDGCSKLTSINIPENVTTIGNMAFRDIEHLKIIFYGNAPTFGSTCFDQSNVTVYYPENDPTWTDSILQNYYGTVTWEPVDVNAIVRPNSLVITEGPISLNTGDMTVISAVYYNENGDSDEIEGQLHWSYTSDDGGEVSLRRSSESFLGYLCEVSGVNTGQCTVTASTDSGLTASVVIDVVPKPEEPKETISITGTEEHLSGSNNYVLNNNQNGVIDFNAPITSEVTINTGSMYQAGRIFIKNNGVLHVGGTLHVSEIHIEAGGVLEISGRVFAGTIIADGGNWLVKKGGILRGSGIVEALDVEFKDYSTCEMTGQLIAKDNFIYSSNKESGSFCGTLFAGGNMDIGKNFKSAGDALTTVIYGDTSGRSFSFHKKCNLGKVFAQNSESYSNVCMSVNNRTSVHQYTSLTPRDHDTWFYGIGNVLFEQEVDGDWASGQGAYYVNLANEQNNAVSISSLSDNTERDFAEKLAIAWIGSIEAQIDRGFMTTSTGTYELYFIMNKKEYVLKYELQGYGSFANLGFLYFGQAGDENLAPIGITSAASIENFKAQAATYLAESYVQEYYKYVTGFKWRTEASMKKKLQQMGTKAVIKYFQKNLEKNLFGTLAVTKGPEYKQLEKTFSISRMTLDGDIKGLWKFAIKEITSQSAKQKTAQLSLPEEATETNNDAETTRNAVTDEITDEYLKRALISALGDDGTGNPDFTNQGEITSLNLSGKYIQSLNGMQNFTNIQTLVLSYNEISDLTPLAEMESLKNLYINGQNIEDLTPLSGLSGLVMLDASDNSISSVAPLSGLTGLNRLVISDNPVESLDGLENLTNLQVLEAESISLDDSDLSALANASSLSELYMDDSGLQSIDELNVSSIRILSIADNEVSSLGCISDAENLERLNAPDNLISSIPSLANCNSLKEIDLSGNILEDLSGLESADSVETLNLSDCELLTGDIQPISGMENLRDLDLSWNPMIDDLSPLYTIESLNSIDASKTDIIVFNNPVIIDSHEISIQADGISLAKTEFDEYTFAGNAIEPNVVIERDGRNLVEDVDFTVSYSDNLAPGTATATVTGTGRCVGTLSIEYLISSFAIVVQPQDVEAANGEIAEFHIEVSGSGIAYQWQVSSTGITWKNCTGAGYNTDTFSFTMKEKFAGRQYRCIVTTDNTTLTSDAATLSLKQSDGIIEQPADAAASVGETVSFHVGFTGDAPTYQWKVSSNGTTWKNCTGPGYDTDTFSFTMKEKFAGRQYKCVVTCGGVAYTSNAATLSLDESLKITSQPEDVTVATGETASFHVEASGENLNYQWQVSSTGTTWKNCTGAGYNTDTFSFTTKRSYSGRKYRCKVSDGTDTAISDSAELTVAN